MTITKEFIAELRQVRADNAALRHRVKEIERYMNGVCEAMEEPSWDNAYDAARVGMLAKKRIVDATSPEGVKRAQNAYADNYEYGICDEDMQAAIRAALGDEVKS